MKNILSFITLLSLSILFLSFEKVEDSSIEKQEKAGIIYFVRHAEKVKDGEDPILTKHGNQRAQELAQYLTKSNIEGIYATDFNRTKNTASPLANKRGVEVEIYNKKKTKKLMKSILKRGGNHLVVGHWGTANDAFSYFNVAPEYNTEEANDNNSLLKVTYSDNKLIEVVLLKY